MYQSHVPPPQRVRHRRGLAAGALSCVAGLLLAGCGTDGTDTAENASTITTLDYYTDEQGSAAWEETLSACEDATGITIERQSVPPDQMLQQILQQVGAQTLPNLIFIDNPQLQQIAETGALTPFSDYDIDTDGYYDSILEAGTYEGEVYGLAPGVNGLALFYNRAHFEDAGVEPPRTWEELRATATELGSSDRDGLAFSAIDAEEGTWQFLPFFWSNGARLSDLDSPEAVAALEYVTALVEEGAASSSVLEWNQNDVADQFVAGHTSMMINGSWNLARLEEEADLDYGVVPIPVPEEGDEPVVALGGEVAAIPASAPEKRNAAAEVLDCVLSEERMMDWTRSHAYVPAREGLAERMADDAPEMAPFVTEVATARSRTARLGGDYPDVSAALIKAVQRALVGDSTPEQALRQADDSAGDGS